jgi:hypothetical protein
MFKVAISPCQPGDCVHAPSKPRTADLPLVVELLCHPAKACPPVRSIQARTSFLDSGTLSLGFMLWGDLDQLIIPPPGTSVRCDELWQHTCFEAFLARAESESYHEVNLSPSTAWATYSFLRYREGRIPAGALEPQIRVHRKADRLELHTILGLDKAVDLKRGEHLRLGLSAIIEAKDGNLSHWAIRHPEGCPDFHRPVCFALELAPGLTP